MQSEPLKRSGDCKSSIPEFDSQSRLHSLSSGRGSGEVDNKLKLFHDKRGNYSSKWLTIQKIEISISVLLKLPVEIQIDYSKDKLALRFSYKNHKFRIPLNCSLTELTESDVYDIVKSKLNDVDNVLTIAEVLNYVLETEECGGNYNTRKKTHGHWLDILKREGISLDSSTKVLLNTDEAGRTLFEQWSRKYGLPHKLRQMKSTFSKKNLVLFKRKGWDCKHFANIVAYVPETCQSLPFSTDDSEIERIINFFDAHKESDPKFYSIYLLAFGAGLRASEIYQVEGKDFTTFNGQHYLLLPFATKRTKLKQLHGAVEKVGISKQVYEHFSHCLPNEKVIGGGLRLHKRFVKFLKEELGIQDNKACHRLRKILGARLATSAGIYHASKTLRNSVAVCERYYSDLTAHANELAV